MGEIESKLSSGHTCQYKKSHYCQDYHNTYLALSNKLPEVRIWDCLVEHALSMGYILHRVDQNEIQAFYPSGLISKINSIESELQQIKKYNEKIIKLITDEQQRRVIYNDMEKLETELKGNK